MRAILENLFLSPDAYYMKCWRSKEINVTFNLFVQNASCNLLLNAASVLSTNSVLDHGEKHHCVLLKELV